MKHLFCLCGAICLLTGTSFAQDNLWMMGYYCCSATLGGMTMDVSASTPIVTSSNCPMNFSATNALISSPAGSLLFYTNGNYIGNRNYDTLLNGGGISPGYYAGLYNFSGQPVQQSASILPFDFGHSPLYHLFHMAYDGTAPSSQPKFLYHSVIDMSLDSGRGAVVVKSDSLIQDTLTVGQLTACRHANGRDWWLVLPKYNSNLYHILLITPYEITDFPQQIGPVIGWGEWSGQATFSPDGMRYVRYDRENGLTMMDFDRCTGLFSNPTHHGKSEFNDNAWGTGAAFSPNSNILYLSSFLYVYQFDLTAANYFTTKTTVAVYDTSGYSFFTAELARNGKIYMIPTGGSNIMHVINYPDSLGMACNVVQHDSILSRYNDGTIPHFPNFRLGPVDGSVCDSLVFENIPASDHMVGNFQLFPNPANRIAYITLPILSDVKVRVINALGRIVDVPMNLSTSILELDVSRLLPGCYTVMVMYGNSMVNRKLIKY
ncbi:MAG TPA: T9SS type A sorting domain-containing protein [Bacteroidia bacterium]|nr:T9SS type A sorting domain-containing protein [Bacteroidia bacterium]